MNPEYLDEIIDIARDTGGCVKFDIKAWSEEVHFALCGVSGTLTKENFGHAAKRFKERKNPPLIVVSTLLVPGYIDESEIKNIASFIAIFDKDIPYSLLGFAPSFCMKDLPYTSREFASRAYKIAKFQGLKSVNIGNIRILS